MIRMILLEGILLKTLGLFDNQLYKLKFDIRI